MGTCSEQPTWQLWAPQGFGVWRLAVVAEGLYELRTNLGWGRPIGD